MFDGVHEEYELHLARRRHIVVVQILTHSINTPTYYDILIHIAIYDFLLVCHITNLHGTVVEHRSLAGELFAVKTEIKITRNNKFFSNLLVPVP